MMNNNDGGLWNHGDLFAGVQTSEFEFLFVRILACILDSSTWPNPLLFSLLYS